MFSPIFVDGYWNSRRQSFAMHLVTLMTRLEAKQAALILCVCFLIAVFSCNDSCGTAGPWCVTCGISNHRYEERRKARSRYPCLLANDLRACSDMEHVSCCLQFAKRVQQLIAATAGVKAVDWDGYMKYFRPSQRFVKKRQQLFANSLKRRLETAVEHAVEQQHEEKTGLRQRS